MKYAFIGLNMEEDVDTIITISKDMIGATDEAVMDTLGMLSEYDMCVETINGDIDECYDMMYRVPEQENNTNTRADIKSLVFDTVSRFYHNIRMDR